jgi:hypothetical protein
MTVRFVVRPPAISKTPRLLASSLDAETRRSDARVAFDPDRDLFLTYPHPSQMSERSDYDRARYRDVYSFTSASKPRQRNFLRDAGVRIPDTATTHAAAQSLPPGRFIVRPYRHHGGQHYRITEDRTDFIEGVEYIQRIFAKDAEYRVIFSFGEPVVVLRKRPPEGISKEVAWNHTNGSTFVTQTRSKNLEQTDFYDKLSKLPIITSGHILAADVLWSHTEGYVVCELNTCPGLTIPSNLERITSHVQSHR